MATFDYGDLDNRLRETDARFDCLSCGSDNVHHADRKVGLVEVSETGAVQIMPRVGGAIVIYCAARICNVCGYVHLYSTAALDRAVSER